MWVWLLSRILNIGVNFPTIAQVKMLDQKHPEYAKFFRTQEDLQLLYKGGLDFKLNATRFLIKRAREIGPIYQDRLYKATFDNILQSIITWYTSKLFENFLEIEFKIEGADTLPAEQSGYYSEFLNNCDNANTSLERFFERLTADILVHNKGIFLIDLPKLNVVPTSLAEQVALGGLNPYFVHYDYTSLQNWQKDSFGAYQFVILHTKQIIQSFLGEPTTQERWTYYDKQNYAIYEATYKDNQRTLDAKLIATGRHALADKNKVPLHVIEAGDRLWLGNRVLLPLVEHLNTDNSLGFSLFQANMAVPVFTHGQTDKTMTSQTAAEYAALALPYGGKFAFVEPEGKSWESSQKRLESIKDSIYRMCHLLPHAKSSKGSDYQSGLAREVAMQPAADVLNSVGTLIRTAIQDGLEDVATIRSDNSHADVRGMTFSEDQTGELANIVLEIKALNIPSPTFQKEMDKKIMRTFLRDANADLVQKCINERETAVEPVAPIMTSVTENITQRTDPGQQE